MARSEHEGRRAGQEPWLGADEQDEPTDEQPADAGLGGQRAGRDEDDGQRHGHRQVRRHPRRPAPEERAEVEPAAGLRADRRRGHDEGQGDQRADEQERVLPDAREDVRGDERDEGRGERAAEGHDQVELGQAVRAGPVLGEQPVQGRGHDAEGDEGHDQHEQDRPATGRAVGHPQQGDHGRGGQHGQPDRGRGRGEKATMNVAR